jgi:glyoxylase-like metal-dependent hydrolase (beta-lactamase superfamily II)
VQRPPDPSRPPPEWQRVCDQILQIGCYWGGGGHTELYLLEGDRLALVDTGVADTPAAYVEPALNAIGRQLADVEIVINTHGHHDHAGGNRQLYDASGCQIWIHSADVAITQDADQQFELFFARNERLLGRDDRLPAARANIAASAGQPAPIARTIADGDRLDLGRGLVLDVVHAPGHTLGCCTLLWEREGIAISGDSVLGRGSRPGGMPLIFYPEQYRGAIERVRALHPRALCLGHHYRTLRQTNESIRFGDLVDAFLDESAEVADLIAGATERAVAAEGRDAPFEPILRRALADLGRAMPLESEPGGDLPNGAVAPISATWSRLTGRA